MEISLLYRRFFRPRCFVRVCVVVSLLFFTLHAFEHFSSLRVNYVTNTRQLGEKNNVCWPERLNGGAIGQSEFTVQILVSDATAAYRAIINSKWSSTKRGGGGWGQKEISPCLRHWISHSFACAQTWNISEESAANEWDIRAIYTGENKSRLN